MTTPQTTTNRDELWVIESLRLTAFPAAPFELRPNDWWQGVVGREPDKQVYRAGDGVRQDSGAIQLEDDHQALLVLNVTALRIDWMLVAPPISSIETIGSIPSIGAPTVGIPRFQQLMREWLQRGDAPPLCRLAFGAVFLRSVPDLPAAYELLAPLVPWTPEPEATDFLLQINHPRPSRVEPAVTINRLSKWQTATMDFIALVPGTPRLIPERRDVVARIEADLSSDAGRSEEIPGDLVVDLLGEMAEEISEGTTRGPRR